MRTNISNSKDVPITLQALEHVLHIYRVMALTAHSQRIIFMYFTCDNDFFSIHICPSRFVSTSLVACCVLPSVHWNGMIHNIHVQMTIDLTKQVTRFLVSHYDLAMIFFSQVYLEFYSICLCLIL